MKFNVLKRIFIQYEYKVIYKRIFFTCFILFIYILGSHIPLLSHKNVQSKPDSFYNLAISNMGGDINRLNIFTLGLGPWLTAMIIFSLFAYRNKEKLMKLTRAEKNYKEKLLTIFISIIQGRFIINEYINTEGNHTENIYILLLVLVTGTMLLVWLADQNSRRGIAGPMPIVMISIIKYIFQQNFQIQTSFSILAIIIIIFIVALLILLFMELVEYRIYYRDLMNMAVKTGDKYLAWKINPSGSISIMISISVFLLLENIISYILGIINPSWKSGFLSLDFTSPIGITSYILIQMIIGYLLSRLLLNTKQKSKDFLKNGNYFIGIKPGEETEIYLNRMARRVCWIGTIITTLIIGIPLYASLLVPHLSQQIYFALQLIVLTYIAMNITETIRTYFYFDRYKLFLNKYW
nr:accessory Sec system protein translocase subunit SecY2 [Mammaliicoccus sp. Marseille-Q6498]